MLRVRIEWAPPTMRAYVDGELDISSTILVRYIAEARWDEVEELRLDLAEVEFVDSQGLTILLNLRDLAAGHGATFALEHPRPALRHLLAVTGLNTVLLSVEE